MPDHVPDGIVGVIRVIDMELLSVIGRWHNRDGSYAWVAAFIRAWQAERTVAQGTTGRGVFVPLSFQPGEAFWTRRLSLARLRPPLSSFRS